MALPGGGPLPPWLVALMTIAVLAARPCRGSERAASDDQVSLMQRSSHVASRKHGFPAEADAAEIAADGTVQRNASASRSSSAKPETLVSLSAVRREALPDLRQLANATRGGSASSEAAALPPAARGEALAASARLADATRGSGASFEAPVPLTAPRLKELADSRRPANATRGVRSSAAAPSSLLERWGGLGQSSVVCPILFVAVGLASVVFITTAASSSRGQQYHDNLGKEDIERVFAAIDKDRSGTLSHEEVVDFIKSSGHAIPENQIAAIIKMADKDGSGDLDCEEFSILLRSLGDEQPRDLRRCLLAEYVGMFLFQFFGGMPDTGGPGNALLSVGLLYLFAPISGAHFNPSLTVAAWMSRQVTTKKAMHYLAVELLAAVEGVLLLRWMGIDQISSVTGVAVNPCLAPAPGIPAWEVLVLEMLSSFTFIMVFLAVAVDAKSGWGNAGPLALGITLIGLDMACAKISGLSMNPARFLAPCLVYGCFPSFWETVCYVAAALAAAAFAASLYLSVFLDRPTPEQHVGLSNFQFMIADHSGLKRELGSKRKTATGGPDIIRKALSASTSASGRSTPRPPP